MESVIVVVTEDFEVYHDVVAALRDRGVRFTTREPGAGLPDRTRVVIRAAGENAPLPAGVEPVVAAAGDARRAVEEAVAMLRGGDGRTIVGADPDQRIRSAQLVNDLDDRTVELVDETGTTPYLGTGARGMGDVLAAVNIARRAGEVTDSREIEPTPGELQRIKDRSREASEDGRTIDEELARRVAAGELTVGEALAAHRERDDDPA